MVIQNIVNELPRHPTRKYKRRNLKDIKTFVVHCTDGKHDTPRSVAEYHISPGCHISPEGIPAIAYSFFIMPNGIVYQTLAYEEISWHVGNWNKSCLGIVLAYKDEGNLPPQEQYDALIKLLKYLMNELNIDEVVGHRELEGTGYIINKYGQKDLLKTCPGMSIDLDQLREDINP